jgi:hypothetical protein
MGFSRSEMLSAVGLVQTGDLKALAMIVERLSRKPLAVTSATLALTGKDHGGRTIYQNRAAGTVFTLPAAKGTGEEFEIVVGATIT